MRIRPLIDKVIIVLGCTSALMVLVDRLFFAPGGYPLMTFTWLTERGIMLYVTALTLYVLRRVLLKA